MFFFLNSCTFFNEVLMNFDNLFMKFDDFLIMSLSSFLWFFKIVYDFFDDF